MQQQRRRSGLILGLVALGGLALTAGPTQADSGPGPYYAKPAWDQQLPAATRYVVLMDWNSEAVLDKETGLVWERAPVITKMTWSAARLFCANRATGGRKGWRLPSVHELPSLTFLEPDKVFRIGIPFLNVQGSYWSATSIAFDPNGKWMVNLNGIASDYPASDLFNVWCVRGGMNDDQY